MISGRSAAQWAQQLVAVERQGKDELYSTRRRSFRSEIDGYRKLETSLKQMSADLKALSKDAFKAKSGKISNENIAKITVDAKAPSGSYQLEVTQLATASRKRVSFSKADAPIPTTGLLELKIGTKSLRIDFASINSAGNGTVESLRDYINRNGEDAGIEASLMRKGDGSVELMLSSQKTGKDNEILVANNSVGFAFHSTVKEQAQDAQFKLNGVAISSASNVVSDVIDGITLELTEVHKTGESSTISVQNDMDTAKQSVEAFVNSYNKLMDEITGLTRSKKVDQAVTSSIGKSDSDKDDKKRISTLKDDEIGVLKGDASIRMLKNRLSDALFPKAGNGMRLSDVGVEVDRNGRLTIKSTKLDKVLKSSSSAVQGMFSGTSGYIDRLEKVMKPFSAREGLIKTKRNNLDSMMKRLEDDVARHNRSMQMAHQRYLKQFSAMENYVRSMNSTSQMFR